MLTAHFGEVTAGHDAEFRRQTLKQHRDQACNQSDPKQAIAVFRAGLNIRRKIAGIHIGDRNDNGWPCHRKNGAQAAATALEHLTNRDLRPFRSINRAVLYDDIRHPGFLDRNLNKNTALANS